MLRRKLLTRIGLLICAFVVGAIGAMWALQDVLGDIDHSNADAEALVGGILAVGTAMNRIEAPSYAASYAAGSVSSATGAAEAPGPARWEALAGELTQAVERLGQHPVTKPGGIAAVEYAWLVEALPIFLDSWTDPEHAVARPPTQAALQASLEMQARVQTLGTLLRTHVADEQLHVGRYFRGLVLVLTLACLVMMNVAIVVLLRTAQIILQPVAALVDGSRELAAEHFDHRVEIIQNDEFGELAHAYNRLAEQLEANEDRKTETLRQLAVTLNHGLNNAMSIIELQLGLLDRQTGSSPTLSKHLREIRNSLSRMAGIVASLKHIRRVVLVDYGPGQKMIDLERSVASEHELHSDDSHGDSPTDPMHTSTA